MSREKRKSEAPLWFGLFCLVLVGILFGTRGGRTFVAGLIFGRVSGAGIVDAAVAEVKSQTPIQCDEYVALENCRSNRDKTEIVFIYTVERLSPGILRSRKPEIRQAAVERLLDIGSVRAVVKRGVRIRCRYYTSDRKPILQFVIGKDDL